LLKLRSLLATLTLSTLAACADGTAPPKPASVRVLAGDAQTGTAGQTLVSAPTFVVDDENGSPMRDVAVSVTVISGGGVLTAAPTRTIVGATSVGTWTLGSKAGPNQLQVQVAGLPALVITANGSAGAAAKILPTTSATVSGRVAEAVVPAPSAIVTDAFDNPIANATVTVSASNGGTAPTSLTADAAGKVDVGSWTLGTIAGQQTLTLTAGAATTSFVATAAAGDPAQLRTFSGDAQLGAAGTVPLQPFVLKVSDRFGNGVANQLAFFTIKAGGGSLIATSARSDTDGLITVSAWTLGRSAVPQVLHVGVGAFGVDVSARVQTDYNIEVRFYGPPMSDVQRALFTNAAARLSAIVTGDVADIAVAGLNLAAECGIAGLPTLSETIDDLVIYASVRDIDGARGILAQAGPCAFRAAPGYHSAVGVMEFDAADLALMAQQGTLQDVITHEMLHVLGIGTLWSAKSLLEGRGTFYVAYTGIAGTRACAEAGAPAICATNVPVENNGGPGTRDSHWREVTFRNELMTGFTNVGGMPLSQITVGSLGDMGYLVNPFAADPYSVPTLPAANSVAPEGDAWEKLIPGLVVLDAKGGATRVKR
jgi:hypothetical protein